MRHGVLVSMSAVFTIRCLNAGDSDTIPRIKFERRIGQKEVSDVTGRTVFGVLYGYRRET